MRPTLEKLCRVVVRARALTPTGGEFYLLVVCRSAKWHWSLGHQRLSIMDPTDAGNQPFVEPDIAVAANGEIYNFRALYDTLPEKVQTVSDSDSEVLMHLYRAFGSSFVPKLDGMFAFVLVDQEKGTFLAARDHVGIKPLYMGKSEGKLMFASELKCLVDVCDDIEEIPNGTYYTPEEGFVKFYNPAFLEPGCVLARLRGCRHVPSPCNCYPPHDAAHTSSVLGWQREWTDRQQCRCLNGYLY
jgi:asparagine synthetase B (glutamine-hydrolysing)